ncbi:lipopolysaccharide transport periplasmic protein LptA [Frateuria aurantia]
MLATARKDDRQKPLQYVANSTHAEDRPNGVTILRGHVVITQGTIKAVGDLARIYLDADTQIDHVVITASQPKAHIEELDDDGNLMTGDADTITYNYNSGIAILTGHADAKQAGRGEFHGDKLTYDTQQSLITGESSGQGGLVHGVIYPKVKPAPAGKPAAGKPAPAAASSAARPVAAPAAASSSQGKH